MLLTMVSMQLPSAEHQVLEHLRIGEAKILAEPVVANILRRMTPQTVVHEIPRAPLQRGDVADVVVRGHQLCNGCAVILAPGCGTAGKQQARE